MEDEYVLLQDDIDDDGEDCIRDACKNAFENETNPKKITMSIKAKFDKTLGTGWNVVMGRTFGAHVVHKTNHYAFG